MSSARPDSATTVDLTEEQKKIFNDFIKTLVNNGEFVNLMVPNNLYYLRISNEELKRKFWSVGANWLSAYRDLATIPLVPTLTNEIEQFFLNYPEALKSAYLEPKTASDIMINPKPYSLLKPLRNYFHDWALEDNKRAKLIVSQPTLYQYSKENIDKENFKTERKWGIFISGYFLVAAIIFCALAIAFPPMAASWLAGTAVFLLLSGGGAYLARDNYKKAQVTPLTDLANSVPDSDAPQGGAALVKDKEKTKDLNLVQVDIAPNLQNDANKKPVTVTIRPFFSNTSTATTQNSDAKQDELSSDNKPKTGGRL